MSLLVGVDVGGTTSTIAIGDHERRILVISNQFATRSADGPGATIADIIHQIIVETERLQRSPAEITAISLATPGPATLDGVLMATPNLDPIHWDRCPIRRRLEEAFNEVTPGIPVSYVGDGQAAALGEFAVRTGKIQWSLSPMDGQVDHFDSLFMVAVGTGLGGGEVRAGVTVQGIKGRAGHAGHLMLPIDAFRYPHDRQLKVGNAFCTAESAISLTALTHQLGFRLTLDKWRDHPLNRQTGTDRDKAKQLRELAASNDPLAVELLDDQARALGIAMLMINYIGDYDRLVIGGGVCDLSTELRDRYIDLVQKSYYQHALDGFRDFDEFSFSVCGDQASVIGSLMYAYGK